MDWQDSGSQSDALTINGRFLLHYVRTMERLQETFEKDPREGLPQFNKFVAYLRSIINDPKRIQKIDAAMIAERERIHSDEFCAKYPEYDEHQKEFMVGFKVINGCMKYVIRTFNVTRQGKDMAGENGLLLEHYLKTMEKMQGTFTNPGASAFNLYVFYLRSTITNDLIVDQIDKDMEKMRDETGELDPQKEYEIGFRVISGCMEYIDRTMKINKRQVKVAADQTDERMPAPPLEGEILDEEEVPDMIVRSTLLDGVPDDTE